MYESICCLAYRIDHINPINIVEERAAILDSSFLESWEVNIEDGQILLNFHLSDPSVFASNRAEIEKECEERSNQFILFIRKRADMSKPVMASLSHYLREDGGRNIPVRGTFESRLEGTCGFFRIGSLKEHAMANQLAAIFAIPNLLGKYLMLYEFVLNHASFMRKDSSQKTFDKYIRTTAAGLSPGSSLPGTIGEIKSYSASDRTTDANHMKNTETEYTFLRNIIAHPDLKKMDAMNSFTDRRISKMLNELVDLVIDT